MRRIFRTRRLSDSSCVVARSCITLVRRYLSLRSCLRSCGQVLGTPGFVQFHRFLPPYKLCSLSATWFVSELSCQRVVVSELTVSELVCQREVCLPTKATKKQLIKLGKTIVLITCVISIMRYRQFYTIINIHIQTKFCLHQTITQNTYINIRVHELEVSRQRFADTDTISIFLTQNIGDIIIIIIGVFWTQDVVLYAQIVELETQLFFVVEHHRLIFPELVKSCFKCFNTGCYRYQYQYILLQRSLAYSYISLSLPKQFQTSLLFLNFVSNQQRLEM